MFRIQHNDFETKQNVIRDIPDTLMMDEWDTVGRLDEPGWKDRYEYESKLICDSIKDKKIKTILEIGSGPGLLSQYVQNELGYDVIYHLIDKPNAKKYFIENKLKGEFFVKDISLDLDTNGLLQTYDLIICNDVLEHVLAPSNILRKIYELLSNDSLFFISIPNWRMAHQFVYRGLWDYDNVMYMLYIHQLTVNSVYGSNLVTPYYPKLDSEKTMPDELIQSWNFYMVCNKKI